MIDICPTITVETPDEYATQLATAQKFAARIHFDVSDGVFSPRKLLPLSQMYLPEGVTSDIHVMVKEPAAELMTLISLRPQLVILHAESDGDLVGMLQELQAVGIAAGIALLPDTSVEAVADIISVADHVLIFGGHLGYQGGTADLSQLHKVTSVRALRLDVPIGWDGGVNDQNIQQIVATGVTVVNVGGFIQHAEKPTQRYKQLQSLVK